MQCQQEASAPGKHGAPRNQKSTAWHLLTHHIIDIPFFKPHPGCGLPVPVRVEIELSLHVLDLGSALLRKDRLNRR